jgi:hypothetical protein
MNAVILSYLADFFQFISSFGIVRLLIEGAILTGLWIGLQRTTRDGLDRGVTWLAIAVPLLVWMVVVWRLALAGVFQLRGVVPPPIPLAIIIPVVVGLVLLMRSQRVAEVLDVMPPTWLIGLQVYRIFGGIFLVQWALGHLNGVFAVPAGAGDFLVGALALPVAFYLGSGAPRGRAIAIAWNVLGILDLVMAVTLGGLSQSGALQRYGVVATPLSYPLIMVPAFAVPQALILHGLSLWQLRRASRRRVAATPGPQFTQQGAGAAATSAR